MWLMALPCATFIHCYSYDSLGASLYRVRDMSLRSCVGILTFVSLKAKIVVKEIVTSGNDGDSCELIKRKRYVSKINST